MKFSYFFPRHWTFVTLTINCFVRKLTKSMNVGLCKCNWRFHKSLNLNCFIPGRRWWFKRSIWNFCTCSTKMLRFRTTVHIKKNFYSAPPLQTLKVLGPNCTEDVRNFQMELLTQQGLCLPGSMRTCNDVQ